MTTVVQILTSGTSWTAPVGLQGTVQVECLGAGAYGNGQKGGGSGCWGEINAFSATVGTAYSYSLGTPNLSTSTGTHQASSDTTWNGTARSPGGQLDNVAITQPTPTGFTTFRMGSAGGGGSGAFPAYCGGGAGAPGPDGLGGAGTASTSTGSGAGGAGDAGMDGAGGAGAVGTPHNGAQGNFSGGGGSGLANSSGQATGGYGAGGSGGTSGASYGAGGQGVIRLTYTIIQTYTQAVAASSGASAALTRRRNQAVANSAKGSAVFTVGRGIFASIGALANAAATITTAPRVRSQSISASANANGSIAKLRQVAITVLTNAQAFLLVTFLGSWLPSPPPDPAVWTVVEPDDPTWTPS